MFVEHAKLVAEFKVKAEQSWEEQDVSLGVFHIEGQASCLVLADALWVPGHFGL